MKVTDYGPRIAPFDSYLKGKNLIGIEIGTDVGAHASALLKYCRIDKLYLCDVWKREFYIGWCKGRLFSEGFMDYVEFIEMDSHSASLKFQSDHTFQFDFAYIDITHDYQTVLQSLHDWYPLIKKGGIIGYRNYRNTQVDPGELNKAVDEFVKAFHLNAQIELGEIILFK